MRRKQLVWAYLCVLSLATVLNLYIPKTEAVAKESIVIPGEAIRLRILANSDFEADQQIKRKVRDAVNAKVELWVKDLTSMEKAKKVIHTKLPEIQAIAEKTVQEQGSNQSVKVEFRKVQFPTKLYGQFLYPAGKYQAILITLGSGEGANWWCVLYPPLCFLDFSNGVAVTSDGFDEKKTAASKTGAADGKTKTAKDDTIENQTEKEEAANSKEIRKEKEHQHPTKPPVKEDKKEESVEEAKSEHMNKEKVSKAEPAKKEEAKAEPVKKAKANKAEPVKDEKPESSKPVKKIKSEEDTSDPKGKTSKKTPVYTTEDEQPVKVKFFVAELWEKLF